MGHSYPPDYPTDIIDWLRLLGKNYKQKDTSRDGDDIESDDDEVQDEIEMVDDALDADESAAVASGHLDEVHAFKAVLSRAETNRMICNSLPKRSGPPDKEVPRITNVTMLAEFGIINALSEWIGKVKEERHEVSGAGGAGNATNDDNTKYPVCHLPPPTSCETTTYTAVFMSHATDRLKKLVGGIKDICSRSATEEVIVVWNSPRSLLESDKLGRELLEWDTDPSHKMRMFFSLENGLENNLLNRYHPLISPKSEAVMYFDDDGPFFDERAMSHVGLELWRRNADVQNAAFPRNLRVLSDRMKKLQKHGMEANIRSILAAGANEDTDIPFTPTCRDRTGDIIEYNYFVFPQFGANMALPSGSIIHRNYLCFIWHPALEELRRYIREHHTHPDDQTVSAIISQLSGKPPRAFPRNVKDGGAGVNLRGSEKAPNSTAKRRKLFSGEFDVIDDAADDHDYYVAGHVNQHHRRLLWQQKNWGPMREEAANSIIGYFGSLNAGSVGWCVGTEYQKKRPRSPGGYTCEPEFPTLDLIPWIKPGGIGYDTCP